MAQDVGREDTAGMVDMEDLRVNDPNAIALLRAAGMTDDQIAKAVEIAQTAQPSTNASETREWRREYWYRQCQIDERSTIFGGSGNGSLNIHHEFRVSGRSNTQLHYCSSGFCFFWASAQRWGKWPWRFVLAGTAAWWKYYSYCSR